MGFPPSFNILLCIGSMTQATNTVDQKLSFSLERGTL